MSTLVGVKGVAKSFRFPLSDVDGRFTTTATVPNTDMTLIQDGVSAGNPTNGLSHVAGGMYSLTLTAGEMDADEIEISIRDQSDPIAYRDQAVRISTRVLTDIENAVWNAQRTDHTDGGSYGNGVQVNDLRSTSPANLISVIGTVLTSYRLNELMITTLGSSPTSGSIGAKIVDILGDTDELQTDDVPSLIAALNDLSTSDIDARIAAAGLATSAEVTAIQNNTRIRVILPPMMERPDSGSTDWVLEIYVYDEAGNMEALDAAPTVTATNESGTDRSGNLGSVTTVKTGHYRVTYQLDSGDPIEQIRFEWATVEGGVTRYHGGVSQVVDTTAVDFTSSDRTDLQTLLSRLTAGRATNLDNLDGSISTVVASIAALNDLSSADAQAACAAALVAIGLDHWVAVADPGDAVVDNSLLAKLVSSAATAAWNTYVNTTDSMQAIRDRGDAAWTTGAGGGGSAPELLVSTTIATLASQTQFTLTDGSPDDDAYNDKSVIVTDSATSTQKAVGVVLDYVGSTKTITLAADPAIFTMAAGDSIDIIAGAASSGSLTAAQVAILEDVKAWLRNKLSVTRSTGDQTVFEADGSTPRITRRVTEEDSDTVAMVPQP